MKHFFKKLWTSIKAFFTGLYKKPLISIEELTNLLSTFDKDGDGKLSANEVWNGIIDLITK